MFISRTKWKGATMNYRNRTQTFQSNAKQRSVLSLPVILLLSVVSASAAADDRSRCHAFYGPFTSVVVQPPACTSPVRLCTNGILTGEFSATYDFTALTQTADPTDPNIVTLTGKSVVTTSKGVIHTDDVSVINFVTGEFVTKALVHKSNLRDADSGGFIAAGNLNLATGQASGNYSAILCSRDDD
jgi:hypothetical protein